MEFKIMCIDTTTTHLAKSCENFHQSVEEHMELLRQGIHKNKKLQADYNRYGVNRIICFVTKF